MKKIEKSPLKMEIIDDSERITLVKLLKEFGNKDVENTKEKVTTIIPGWTKAVKNFGGKASIEYLREVKVSLVELVKENGKCCQYPVHEAALIGADKLIEIMLSTSYDFNTKDHFGRTPWISLACGRGKPESAQLIIQKSKAFGIGSIKKQPEQLKRLKQPGSFSITLFSR